MLAAGSLVDLRLAAELADHHHQRVVQHSAIGEIVKECRDARIDRWKEFSLHPLELVAVSVPVLNAAHVGLYDRHTGLDEPPRHQDRLPKAWRPYLSRIAAGSLSISKARATLPDVRTDIA